MSRDCDAQMILDTNEAFLPPDQGLARRYQLVVRSNAASILGAAQPTESEAWRGNRVRYVSQLSDCRGVLLR